MPCDIPLHPKLAVALSALPAPNTETEAFHVAVARGLIAGYHDRWHADTWTVAAVEEEFHVPIINPVTRARSRLFSHAGKFDGLLVREGERYLLEHKTCAEDISPGSFYWRRLAIDTQISGYLLASWLLGQRLTGVLYDVIRKPEIRPKKLGLKDTFVLRSTGSYFDRAISADSYRAFSLDSESRETCEMFEARLAADTRARPDWYFGRQIVTRLDKEILAYAGELWQTAQEIHRAIKARDQRRNDKACFAYFRPCEFFDLCAGHARPESGFWQHLPTLHPELEGLTDDGSRVLTHSRIGVFATCRRKHHYRYERGLSAAEEPEALTFGRLLHAALAAWWQTEGNDASSQATDAHDCHLPDATSSEPPALACRARLGQDESGRPGTEALVPHDQE